MVASDSPRPYVRFIVSDPLFIPNCTIQNPVIGRVYLSPISIPNDCIIDRFSYYYGVIASNGNVRIGLYPEGTTPDSPLGSNIIVESASVATPATYGFSLIPIADTVVKKGLYFIGLQFDDVLAAFRYGYDLNLTLGSYYDQAYGPFTSPCPALTANWNPIGYIRVKTVIA